MKNKSNHRFFVIMVVAGMVVGLLTAAFWDYTQDDVFITYVYSRNLADGQGFVFNVGEKVQGTTTPLHTLIMAGVYFLSDDLLHAGNLLSAIYLMFAIGLALRFTQNSLSFYGQLTLALILATSPLIYVSFGMETLLYCALLMLGFWLWQADRPILAMATAATLTWVRADGIVLGGTLGLLAVGSAYRAHGLAWRKFPWKLALVYAVGIAPWFLFAWLYFGTPLPNTFGAKQEALSGITFLEDGVEWWRIFYFDNNPLALVAFPLVILGAIRLGQMPKLRVLPLWALLYLVGYTILNVTAFWYYTPLFTILVVFAVYGAEWTAQWLVRRTHYYRPILATTMLLVVIFSGLTIARAYDFAEPPPRVATYVLAGHWIKQHTDENGVLMVGDLGLVGYYAERRTIDTPGLISPDLNFVNQDAYAVAVTKPNYVFATRFFSWVQFTEQPWFTELYRPLAAFSTKGDGEFSPMTAYARRYPSQAPFNTVAGRPLGITCQAMLHQGQTIPTSSSLQIMQAGERLIEAEQVFLQGQYPASQAPADERISETLVITDTLAVGEYDVHWQEPCQGQTQSLTVMPLEEADGYQPLENLQWADFVQLHGVWLPNGTQVWSGGELDMVLNWQPLARTTEDQSVLVHLLDSSGAVVAQSDGYLRFDTVYTSQWDTDTTVIEERRIQLPPNLPAGEYRVRIGWYDWRTGERFLLSDGTNEFILPMSIQNQFPGGSGLP